MHTLLLFICLLLVVASYASIRSVEEDKRAFLAFQKKYSKIYEDPEEFNYRFRVFRENIQHAIELQSYANVESGAHFGITKFMDLTQSEFSAFYKMPNVNFDDYVAPPPKTNFKGKPWKGLSSPNPTNYDWSEDGAVTAVYNQGQCGSCWAFSATETIESYNFLANGNLVSLSMEQIVDCDTADHGCEGGFPSSAYQYVEEAGGLEPFSDYPYTAENGESGSCQFNSEDVACNVTGYSSINGENGIYAQLSSESGGPVSVCVDASSWQYYQGGVLNNCTNNVDHCVQATGYYNYGESGAYWNVRNSWGADWGENGYIWIAIGEDLCSIGDYATIVQV